MANPSETAKRSGTPNNRIMTRPAGPGWALRANRCAHARRAWARSVRVSGTGGAARGAGRVPAPRSPAVGGEAIGCRHADEPCDSSHARGEAQNRPPLDATGRSPGVALGCPAMPLALLAQGTGTTTADAGRIHDPQAPIGFSAPLVRKERLPSRTAQRPIWLLEKVATPEAALFPGQGRFRGSIPRDGRSAIRE